MMIMSIIKFIILYYHTIKYSIFGFLNPSLLLMLLLQKKIAIVREWHVVVVDVVAVEVEDQRGAIAPKKTRKCHRPTTTFRRIQSVVA